MLNDHIDELVYENKRDALFRDDAASSKSDELRSIASFSVLSEPDRKIVAAAGRWLRHVWLEACPGSSLKLDGIDHDAVFEAMRALEDLAARTLPEARAQLSRHQTNLDQSQLDDIEMDARRDEVAWREAHPKPEFERR